MKLKTTELHGAALDWAVAKCEVGDAINEIDDPHFYSTDWAQGGSIIERFCIELSYEGLEHWEAQTWDEAGRKHGAKGHTPLVAVMRVYVASQLGDEVEVPEELEGGAK